MAKIEFGGEALTALEIREPLVSACETTAAEFDLFADFVQGQQAAFTGYARHANRERIGNGKHKSWSINFQPEPRGTNRPTIVGFIVVRSHFDPEQNQYGGFDYGKYGQPKPTYRFITLDLPSEVEHWRPKDPDPRLFAACVAAARTALTAGQESLF
ncbi:MAG TPA: hypothetical protein VHB51_02745 [Candidatus Saccharimonadales bacterium]|nr:hypothetical protein [Candidatus Saccharimonadales bacterium]